MSKLIINDSRLVTNASGYLLVDSIGEQMSPEYGFVSLLARYHSPPAYGILQ